ncbi:hypothetical protein NP234_24525 [Salmonella enterica]|nr:hypothetical protein [Salmonella enterica]
MQQTVNNTKKMRLKAIESIVRETPIDGQEKLLKLLKDKGFSVTQATLSRDFNELQIVKVPDGDGGYRYLPHPQRGQADAQPSTMVSVEVSGQMAVIRTRPGYASALAAEVDDARLKGVMGTVAGDDTVLVILRADVRKDVFLAELATVAPEAQQKAI